MDRRQEIKAGSFASERHIAMQFAAFAFLGMAVGEPATIAGYALDTLPGTAAFFIYVKPLFVLIGVTMVARILWAPFLDAHNPPLLGLLGRRRGWVALLLAVLAVLAVAIGLLAPPPRAPPSSIYIGLLLAAMLVAGGLFAAVDGLRSVQQPDRNQGILAVGQYAGVFVPTMVLDMVTRAGGGSIPSVSGLAVSGLWVMTGFLAAGWIGLWLLPGKDTAGGRVADLPRVRRLLASGVNLSAGGLRLVAWLHGVFICPVVDFFERHGKTALLAIAVLVLGDIANNWSDVRVYKLYPNPETLGPYLQSFRTTESILNALGLITGAALVFWRSPLRALVAALAIVMIVVLANTIAYLTVPALTPLIVSRQLGWFASGAYYSVVIAVIARLVTPRFAALQFSLLLVAAIPITMLKWSGLAAEDAIGFVGTQGIFVFITAIAIGLAIVLARRLDPGLQPTH